MESSGEEVEEMASRQGSGEEDVAAMSLFVGTPMSSGKKGVSAKMNKKRKKMSKETKQLLRRQEVMTHPMHVGHPWM